MCLILFAYQTVPGYRLVLAANRDEFYARPTAPAGFWEDAPGVLAGQDQVGAGTWMGITRAGRVAALTNVRDPALERPRAPSRGGLVIGALRSVDPAHEYLAQAASDADRYNGFNLLVGDVASDAGGLYYFSNREGTIRRLSPGLYGLSNHLLDTPWPKVQRGKAALARAFSDGPPTPGPLLDLLADTTLAPDADLPDTGVGLDWERALSAMCIRTPDYGTRVATVLLVRDDGHVTFVERPVHPADGRDERRFTFAIDPA